MATPQEKFVEALRLLKELQDRGVVGIHISSLPNIKHRQLLIKHGFIREVSKGWYIATDPAEINGETTAWFSSYWEFIAQYLEHKYNENWCLSADQSLAIHAGNWTIPEQLIVRSSKGNNKPTPLPYSTSFFNLKTDIPAKGHLVVYKGIRLYSLQAALVYCTAASFSYRPIDARTALSLIRDASEVLPILLENGHTKYAGRLAGAFRNNTQEKIAVQIIETFKQADYEIRVEDPFNQKLTIQLSNRTSSPYVNRIRLMWQQMREVVLAHLPPSVILPNEQQKLFKVIDDIYLTDAYHSLSIERYKVTPALIEKVSSGKWNLKDNMEDRKQRDAMAARGYYQSFLAVKESIKSILDGGNPGVVANNQHSKWYRELFDPSVAAGILRPSDLAGYRSHQVYIGNSKHVPLSVDAMRDAMPVLFELLEEEKEAAVRAVLGHFIFVFIHPYMDGNGRIGRFLMNVMLVTGGYPWIVIPFENRDEYMKALESASVAMDIEPFAKFISLLLKESLSGKSRAVLPKQ